MVCLHVSWAPKILSLRRWLGRKCDMIFATCGWFKEMNDFLFQNLFIVSLMIAFNSPLGHICHASINNKTPISSAWLVAKYWSSP
jgi:hypothetical protein